MQSNSGRKGCRILTFLFLGIFAVSLVVSFVATRQVRDVATQRGWISIPRGGRHVHENPLPRLGGVAIFLAFSFSLVLWLGLAVIYPKLLEGLAPATQFGKGRFPCRIRT